MSYHAIDVAIDSFEPDPDGFIRIWLPDIEERLRLGQVVCICDDEIASFARVEKFEGDPVMGFACLKELTGAQGEDAAEQLADDGWCDVVDE